MTIDDSSSSPASAPTLNLLQQAADEIRATVSSIDPTSLNSFVDELSRASHVAVYGVGREGLAMRAFAMRLHHLGVFEDVSVVGDMTAARLSRGHLLVVSAGPGFFSTVDALVQTALNAHARVICLTARPSAPIPARCHLAVHVPARTMAGESPQLSVASHSQCQPCLSNDRVDHVLPMGSAYEGALFVLLEVVIYQLRLLKGVTELTMRLRHTNLE